MPSASETMATAVTKGVLKSVRKADVRLRIKALDERRYCGVYRFGRHALGLATVVAAMESRTRRSGSLSRSIVPDDEWANHQALRPSGFDRRSWPRPCKDAGSLIERYCRRSASWRRLRM